MAEATSGDDRGVLAGKFALVSGGTLGIGEAVVRQLAARGCKVFFCGRDVERGQAVEASVAANLPRPVFIPADLTVTADIERLMEQVLAGSGGVVDILVNNAGATLSGGSVLKTTEEEWDRSYALNVK